MLSFRRSYLTLATAAALGAIASPAMAAEEIVVSGGSTDRSFSVSNIEAYATTGELDGNIEPFLTDLTEPQSQALRDSLQYDVSVNFVPFAKFWRSGLGTTILDQTATVIRPGSDEVSGRQALRSAIVRASEDGSFDAIELLERYPTTQIEISEQEIRDRVDSLQTFAGDVQLLLAAAGVTIDTSDATFNRRAFQNLVQSGLDYAADLREFAVDNGLNDLELNADAPPKGTVTLSKAEVYDLYQQLKLLGQRTAQFYENSGIEVEYEAPTVE
ncbi:MAG: alpha/beta hydrolase [Cyanobacteria bacterium J06639_1]